MSSITHMCLGWLGVTLGAAATVYGMTAWLAAYRFQRPHAVATSTFPPVTVLKPLHGVEPQTYECLRSFCVQIYPQFQVLFGVADPSDPAVAVVERLRHEFPSLDLQLAVDRRQHGSNRKVSNLINMMPLARHEYLVLSDSDVCVPEDYLARLVKPLTDEKVGIVTCAYRGRPTHGIWSLLGSQFINDWFVPSVQVAALAGSWEFAFGATIAIRRQVLVRIGGFTAIANQLADDYRLGELTRMLGLNTVLSDLIVDISVTERSLSELWGHELRWLRTIRAVRPWEYAFCFVTFSLPVAALGALLDSGTPLAWAMLSIAFIARVGLHFKQRCPDSHALSVVTLPLRDSLNLCLWIWSFATRRVTWKHEQYQVARDGTVLPIVRV